MKTKKNARDAGIELARIIGCLIVIGVHITLTDIIDGVYDLSRGFINCLVADGVAVFWIISGCFLFRAKSYKKVLLRSAKSIALPMAILSILCFYLSAWAFFGTSLSESISHTAQEYWDQFKNALSLNPAISGTGHLWYCYVYLLIMVLFPVLRAFVLWLEEDVKREKTFLILSFLLLALNDLTLNQMAKFSHHAFNAAIPAAIEMIWGHILYRHRDYFKKSRFEMILLSSAPILFVVLNLLRVFIVDHTGSKAILYWYSTIGLLCALCLITFCMLFIKRMKSDRAKNAINVVGSYTFLIYLIHLPIRGILFRYSLNTLYYNWLSKSLDGFLLELSYTLFMTFTLFFISLLIGVVLRGVLWLFKRITSLSKKSVHIDL